MSSTSAELFSTTVESKKTNELIFSNLKGDSCILNSSSTSRPKVIVIGAGMAGITAAKALVEDGYEVTILEAREVVGGRARTIQSKNKQYSFPAGPMFLENIGKGYGPLCEGMDNPLIALLQKRGFKPKEIFEEDPDGVRILGTDSLFSEESIGLIMEQYASIEKFSATQLREFALKATQSLNSNEKLLAAKIAQATLVSHSGLSEAELFEREQKLYKECNFQSSGFTSELDDRFVSENGGYQQLLNDLFQEAEKSGRLSCKFKESVHTIEEVENIVVVKTNNGIFKADAVVCTIPLSVLRKGSVTIKGLPGEIKTAMEHFTMGLMNKVILEFPEVFWPNTDYINIISLDMNASCPIRSFLNMHKITDGKTNALILSFYAEEARDPSTDLKKVNEFKENLTRIALENLREAFGEIPSPILVEVTAWDKDPYTGGGSWTTYGPKITQKDFDALRKGALNGKLVFAGDYGTLGLSGNMTAAHYSGLQAKKHLDLMFTTDLAANKSRVVPSA